MDSTGTHGAIAMVKGENRMLQSMRRTERMLELILIAIGIPPPAGNASLDPVSAVRK